MVRIVAGLTHGVLLCVQILLHGSCPYMEGVFVVKVACYSYKTIRVCSAKRLLLPHLPSPVLDHEHSPSNLNAQ